MHQEALPAAIPCDFLNTFVESYLHHTAKIAVCKELRYPTENLPGLQWHQPATCVKVSKHVQCCNWCPQHPYWALGIPENGTGCVGTGRGSVASRSLLCCSGTIITNTNLILAYERYTHLFHCQSSRYLSSFLIHSSLWISRIEFWSAYGLLSRLRPLRSDTTAMSQLHLRQNGMKQCQSGLSQLTQYAVTWN